MYLKIAQRRRTQSPGEPAVIGDIISAETYECRSVSFTTRNKDDIGGDGTVWVMDFDTPEPRNISIYEMENTQTDVYVMNDKGKTIEHYVY